MAGLLDQVRSTMGGFGGGKINIADRVQTALKSFKGPAQGMLAKGSLSAITGGGILTSSGTGQQIFTGDMINTRLKLLSGKFSKAASAQSLPEKVMTLATPQMPSSGSSGSSASGDVATAPIPPGQNFLAEASAQSDVPSAITQNRGTSLFG